VETYRQLALLSDRQAKLVLNRIISGLVPANPELARPSEVKAVMTEVAARYHVEIKPNVDNAIKDQSEVIRLLLIEFVDSDELRDRLVAALQMDREVLFDPVTAALIMAGIVVLLQTNAHLAIKIRDGKTSVDFSLDKKPTTEGLIKKFFGFFK
jgi:hypothetical protein